MQRKPIIRPVVTDAGSPCTPPAREPLVHKALAGTAFMLLAAAICMRPLFRELFTVVVPDLLAPPPSWWDASPQAMYLAHLLAGGGVALVALWVVLGRRPWRFSGLEIGAAAMLLSASLSFQNASDKRLAINAAIGTILPLIVAAMLYQLLAQRPLWRRALLAALLAIAAANAWKGTAQHFWEADQALRDYQQQKASLWAQMGRSADDPLAQIHEARLKTRQPTGYFFHPNVMASFLLLGLAATIAAAAGFWPAGRRRTNPGPAGNPLLAALVPTAVLGALAAWLLCVIGWVGSAGAMAGLVAALATGLVAWWLRSWPRTLAAVLATSLILLQAALVVLALFAGDLYHSLEARGGKVKSMAVRLNYWDGAIRLFEQHPLVGVGPGQFGKYYTAFKPPYASEDVSHPHNWLLNQAAEWGTLGLVGLLVALAGPGWRILRSLAQPVDDADRSSMAPLLSAALVVLGCWGLLLIGGWNPGLLAPMAASLIVVIVVSLARRDSRLSQAVLLAGLVGFFVHAMVEMTSGVPGALWPFWATVALAMTWASPEEATPPAARRRIARLALILPAAVALAVVAWTAHPLRSIDRMGHAQHALRTRQPDLATHLLEEAAAADPRDPTPLKAAALLRQRMARQDPSRSLAFSREAAALFGTAAQRDPASYMVWRNLAMADMYLATQLDDFAVVRQAVEAMQKALALYPNWPAGWLELANMAAVQSGTQPDQPTLLQIAMDALDKAEHLDDLWPRDDARKFKPQDRVRLQQMRQQFAQRLRAPV